jgi:hypothetical protein
MEPFMNSETSYFDPSERGSLTETSSFPRRRSGMVFSETSEFDPRRSSERRPSKPKYEFYQHCSIYSMKRTPHGTDEYMMKNIEQNNNGKKDYYYRKEMTKDGKKMVKESGNPQLQNTYSFWPLFVSKPFLIDYPFNLF